MVVNEYVVIFGGDKIFLEFGSDDGYVILREGIYYIREGEFLQCVNYVLIKNIRYDSEVMFMLVDFGYQILVILFNFDFFIIMLGGRDV